MWDTATATRTRTWRDGKTVDSLAFSPDGKTLAIGGASGQVILWNTATGQRSTGPAEPSRIVTVSFSRAGILVAGDDLGDISIWNTPAGKLFATPAAGSSIADVTGYALSPNGRILAVAGSTGTITLFRMNLANLSQGHFEHLICGEIRMNLTSDEWAKYVPGQPYQKTCPAYP